MESFQPIVADFNEILFDMENVPNCEWFIGLSLNAILNSPGEQSTWGPFFLYSLDTIQLLRISYFSQLEFPAVSGHVSILYENIEANGEKHK
jgi:hypothetical protein